MLHQARRGNSRQLIHIVFACFCWICACQSALAQSETTFLSPPLAASSEQYRAALDSDQVQTDTRYVDETEQSFLSESVANRRAVDPVSVVNGINGLSIAIVVLLICLLIFLFLKFGGAGGLLSSDPQEKAASKKRKKAWGLTAETEDAADIIAKIRAMSDRKSAMILLLRHCLLQASQETNVNFRRSDTERDALKRLPRSWRKFDVLGQILRSTELVHYGGRAIDDQPFESAIAQGETILRYRT